MSYVFQYDPPFLCPFSPLFPRKNIWLRTTCLIVICLEPFVTRTELDKQVITEGKILISLELAGCVNDRFCSS
jgi:hypothetical protein